MYNYRQNLMNSSIYTCSGYCYQASQNESGRSMVEMLGVLAVIGVLSVAGIAGYTTAMNKHRANEVMYEASKRSVIGMTQLASGRTPNQISFAEFTNDTVAGATFDSNAVPVGTSTSQFGVKVSNVEKSICQNLVNMAGGNVTVAKATTPTTPMTAADCSDNKEQNVLAFIYGEAPTNTPSPAPSFRPSYGDSCDSGGELICSNNDWQRFVCADGHWNYTDPCYAGYCKNGECVDIPQVSSECEPGEGFCVCGYTPYKCHNEGGNYVWKQESSCDAGSICFEGECISGCYEDWQCSEGKCVNHQCSECLNDADCRGAHCESGQCVQCRNDVDCSGFYGSICKNKHCMSGCHTDEQCHNIGYLYNTFCNNETNWCESGCHSDNDCILQEAQDGNPLQATLGCTNNQCVKCQTDDECISRFGSIPHSYLYCATGFCYVWPE